MAKWRKAIRQLELEQVTHCMTVPEEWGWSARGTEAQEPALEWWMELTAHRSLAERWTAIAVLQATDIQEASLRWLQDYTATPILLIR